MLDDNERFKSVSKLVNHLSYLGLYSLTGGSHVLHRLMGKHKKKYFSETTRSRALVFGMWHNLVDLYQVCSNYALGAVGVTEAYINHLS